MNSLKSFIRKKDQSGSGGIKRAQDKCAQVEKASNESAIDELAGALLSLISKKSTNAVISPSCLYQTLVLASEITDGETRGEIVSVLGGDEEMRKAVESIAEIKAPEYGCKDFHYSMGASVWLDEGVRVSDDIEKREDALVPIEFEQVVMGADGASARMGEWLARNTGGVYPDAPKVDAGTLMVAMGAMHLKDSWSDEFDEDDPRPFKLEDGSTQNTDFMLDWNRYDYLERGGSITLSKELTSGCTMCVSMPREGVTVGDYIRCGDAWRNIEDYAKGECTESSRDCKLYMPKFDLKSDGVDVAGLVESLGIEKIFNPGADFSPVSPDALMVSDILQSTRLTIDEQGLEGASYVAMMMCMGISFEEPPEPKEIVIDRPFVVTVFSPDATPLFVGVVMVPEEGDHLLGREASCPVCHSDDVARILWGEPAYDEQLRRNLAAGRAVLGGCRIPMEDEAPAYHCNTCQCEFGKSEESRDAARAKAQDQLRGIVYGAAVGDALGVPYEFMKRGSFECTGMVGGGAHGMPAGTFSDDTSLMLATCASYGDLHHVDVNDMRDEFARWLYEGAYTTDGSAFDVGNATATAIEQGRGCDGERSNGNGSLMRIAPLALTTASDDEIRDASAVTHAHVISKEACVAFVHILREVLRGEALAAAIEGNIPDDPRFGFMHDIELWSRDDVRSTGYVIDTLGAALWCALNTDDYASCVLAAVNLGDDSDTTACVAGALAGAMYGYGSIPREWIEQLRGKDVIEDSLEWWF